MKTYLNFNVSNKSFNSLINDYEAYSNCINKNSKRILTPIKEFFYFIESFRNKQSLKKINSKDLLAFYEYMQSRISMNENMPLKSSTISNYLKCINLFFKYLSDRQILEGTIIFPRKIINEDVEQKFITIEELKLIFEQCSSEREKAILSLAYGCGLRKSEIQNLNVEDFYYQASIIVIKMGKGQLRREVPLSDNVKEQLKKYIYEERSLYILEHNRLENAFILNNRGGRMTGEHLGVHLKNLILKTENETLINKKITLHSLRHSIAIHLIDHGATIEFVKNFLGHKDIDTTQLYARRRKRKTILMRAIHFD